MITFRDFAGTGCQDKFKNNVDKTKWLRVRISVDEKVTLGNEKIDQMDSHIYLNIIISKDGESSGDVNSKIVQAQGVFFSQ